MHWTSSMRLPLLQASPWHQWPTLASVSGTSSLPLTLNTFTRP